MIKTRPQKTLSVLISELDEVFATFIKLRDTDSFGYGRCHTCGRRIHYKLGDCGHGIHRQHMATRFDERNCALQCVDCNRFEGGQQEKFAAAVDRRSGPGTWEYLQNLSKTTVKLTRPEVETMVQYYKDKVRQMKKI
jgi:hypothetical protein